MDADKQRKYEMLGRANEETRRRQREGAGPTKEAKMPAEPMEPAKRRRPAPPPDPTGEDRNPYEKMRDYSIKRRDALLDIPSFADGGKVCGKSFPKKK